MTVKQFYSIYAAYEQKHYAYTTYQSRTSFFRNFVLRDFGDMELDRINAEHIKAICQNMAGLGLSEATIRDSACSALLSFFKLAKEQDWISDNTVSLSRQSAASKKVTVSLDAEDPSFAEWSGAYLAAREKRGIKCSALKVEMRIIRKSLK